MVKLRFNAVTLVSPFDKLVALISPSFTHIVKFPKYTDIFCSGKFIYLIGLGDINVDTLTRSCQGSSFRLTMHGLGFRYFIKNGLLNLKMACSHNITMPPAINVVIRAKKNSLIISSFFSNSCVLYSTMSTKVRIVRDYSFKGVSLMPALNKKVIKNNSW